MSRKQINYPHGPFAIGLIGSAIIGLLTVIFLHSGCIGDDCLTNFQLLGSAEPNVVGDTLAGLAGAFALFWIIITAWHQSSELAEQRRIVEEQKDEVALQRKTTQEIAQAMAEQAKLHQMEHEYRESELADRVIDALESKLQSDIFQFAFDSPAWRFNFHIISEPDRGNFERQLVDVARAKYVAKSISATAEEIKKTHREVTENLSRVVAKPKFPGEIDEIIEVIEEIITNADHATASCKIRIRHSDIHGLYQVLANLRSDSSLWFDEAEK